MEIKAKINDFINQDGTYGATALDVFNFSKVKDFAESELSADGLTWTFYAQTLTEAERKLIFEYYTLPSGGVLTDFMNGLDISGESVDNTLASAAIIDEKANIANRAADNYRAYTTRINNLMDSNGENVGGRYVAKYSPKPSSTDLHGSYYTMDDEKFYGYEPMSYISFYRGNGNDGYGPASFVTTAGPVNVRRNSSGNIVFNMDGLESGRQTRNSYALFLHGSNDPINKYRQAVYDLNGDSDGTYYVVKLVYVPLKRDIEFMNGDSNVPVATLKVYTDWTLNQSVKLWDNTPDYVTGTITQAAAYNSYLKNGLKLNGIALTDPSNMGRTFAGWYYDKACSDGQEFDPDKPVKGPLKLYAKWEATRFVVQIDPAGGVIGGSAGGSTWWRADYGEKITPYTNIITREFDEYIDGSYYYHHYTYEGNGGTYDPDLDSAAGVSSKPRTATYTTDSTAPASTEKYRYLPDVWRLERWDYQIGTQTGTDENGAPVISWGTVQQDYDFTKTINSHIKVIAVWRKVVTLRLAYDFGDGTEVELADGSALKTIYGDDANVYLDGSVVVINKAAKPNSGNRQFLGWKVKGGSNKLYPLGSAYTVDTSDADNDMVITLVAQYGTIPMTSVAYNANGGAGTLTDLAIKPGSQQKISTNRVYDIELNDTITLSAGAGFHRAGYRLVGWSRYDNTDPDQAFDFNPGTMKYEVNQGYEASCFELGQEDAVIDGATGNILYAVWAPVPILNVTKTVTGDMGDLGKAFVFTIEGLENNAEYSYARYVTTDGIEWTAATGEGASGIFTSDGNGRLTFTLAHHQKIVIGLPVPENSLISLSENNENYTAKYVFDNGTETLGNRVENFYMTDDHQADFTNNLKAVAPTAYNSQTAPFAWLLILGTALAAVTAAWVYRKRREDADM